MTAYGGVVAAAAGTQGTSPDGRVVVCLEAKIERARADCRVEEAGGITLKRRIAIGYVKAACGVIKQGERSSCRVMAAAVVKDKRVGSNGRILCAACVEQKRCSAHCGIGIRVVEGQRSAANTGVEAAGGI